MLQASIGSEPQAYAPGYQFKHLKGAPDATNPPQNAPQNSRVQDLGLEHEVKSAAGSSHSSETQRKNLELLRSILADYTPSELETEIFTLNEVLVPQQKQQSTNKAGRKPKSVVQQSSTQVPGKQQIVLNEK